MQRAYIVKEKDSVATALDDLAPGQARMVGAVVGAKIMVRIAVQNGHKIALKSMAPGDAVIKYGAVIGYATDRIEIGDWVHVHNMRSGVDETTRVDAVTGTVTDTQYI
jgi:hypothetical protein